MRRSLEFLSVLLCVGLLPSSSPAPIVDGCETVAELIGRSESIAAIRVRKQVSETPGFAWYEEYAIDVEHVLKGQVAPKQCHIRMRYLPMPRANAQSGFLTNKLYLVFLESDPQSTNVLRSINCPGAHWQIPPDISVGELQTLSLTATVSRVIGDQWRPPKPLPHVSASTFREREQGREFIREREAKLGRSPDPRSLEPSDNE